MPKPQSQHHSKGDLLTIYEDPITRLKPEGFARLEKFIRDIGDGYERWQVRFRNQNVGGKPATFEETTYERTVQP